MFKGGNWHMKKTFNVGFFLDAIKAWSFKLLIITTMVGVYIVILLSRFDNVDFALTLRAQVCQKYKLQIVYFGFMSSVVFTWCGCYIHCMVATYIKYDLCDTGVYSREMINMFFHQSSVLACW